MQKLLFFIVLSFSSTTLFSQEIYHYQDKTMEMDVNSVNNLGLEKFIKLKDNRFTYPLGDYNHWFAFEVVGDGDNTIIHIDEPYLDIVNLYYRENSSWVEEKNGLIINIEDKLFPHRLPVFKQKLGSGEKRKYFLKIYTKRTLLNTGIHIESEKNFYIEEIVLQPLYLIFIGSMISIIIYNLFILLKLKQSIYLYYILFGFFQLIWIILYSGFDIYISPSYEVNHFLSICITLSSLSLVLFFNNLLNLKKSISLLYKINRVLIIYMILVAVLTLIDVRLYVLVILSGIPIPLYLICITVVAFYKKLNQSSYLLFGMSWYIIGLIVIAGVNMGLIPYHNFTRYLFIAGSFIEFITYSIALASRVDTLQKALLKKEEEISDKLKKLVKERTTELKKANIELEKLAIRDPLTGLYNRRFFNERLTSEWKRLSRSQNFLGCIMIDVDHFKKYNDNFGHINGDNVLIKVSNSIKEIFARSSDICARYGGEEFIVLTPETSIDDVINLSIRLINKIRELKIPHITDEKIVTISMGITTAIPSLNKNEKVIIEEADKALYLSKDSGRNQVNTYKK